MSDKRSTNPRRKPVLVAIVAGVAVVALWAVWPQAFSTVWPATGTPATNLHRVLLIKDGQAPVSPLVASRLCGTSPECRNGAGGIDIGVLVAGIAPTRPTEGVVITDANCTPDRYGISHCLNQVRFANGKTITLRHDHNMQLYPCLRPGEKVRVESAVPS